MRRIIWKIRYAYLHNRALRAGWIVAWEEAAAWLEMDGDNISDYDPADAVDETVSEWKNNC